MKKNLSMFVRSIKGRLESDIQDLHADIQRKGGEMRAYERVLEMLNEAIKETEKEETE
jgi:hypothetical protein